MSYMYKGRMFLSEEAKKKYAKEHTTKRKVNENDGTQMSLQGEAAETMQTKVLPKGRKHNVLQTGGDDEGDLSIRPDGHGGWIWQRPKPKEAD